MSESIGVSVPRQVTMASIFWIPQLLLQAVVIVLMFVVVAQAVGMGGPAYDYIIFIAAPIGIPVTIITVVEIVCVMRLRRASRKARVTLTVFAALTALYSLSRLFAWIAALTQEAPLAAADAGAPDIALWETPIEFVLSGLLIAATVLTFTAPSRAFFRRSTEPAAEEPTPTAPA